MANKHFVKPIKIMPAKEKTLEDWQREADNRERICQEEYCYCLLEAKRLHPEWTLKQRQEYARNSAQSLFD